MPIGDVVVDGLWKTFRIYHQRSSTLKQAILRRGTDVYDEFWALRDVSFHVGAGTTLGLIGANGAGKSTMLKVLSRILVPDKGAVRTEGRVSALLELGAGFHPELSGRENIFLNGTILGMSHADLVRRFDSIVEFSGLEQSIDKAVKTYSSGMQARLGFAVAVSIEPDILIVDEVLAVGDEQFQRRCLERMDELRSGGRTAIFVSHGLSHVQQICDRAVWLDKGVVAADGATEDVISAYLRSVMGDTRVDARGRERMGTGEVELDLDLLVDGQSTTTVTSGDPLTVRLTWSSERGMHDLQFLFRIHSADGVVVAGDRLHDEGVARLGPGAGHVDYRISTLALVPGAYHVSASVEDRHTGHVYDGGRWLSALDVVPHGSELDALGYFRLDGSWCGSVRGA
ncbi:MAG TPA: ABC transporter ATP-binding protein [Ilumatobacter sp.]|nr:ABC transporter ATP-binding protein [Ilumatobacter sp.]